MSQGYEQFFKKAKAHRKPSKVNVTRADEATAEQYLRAALKVKDKKMTRKKQGFPVMALAVIVFGFFGAVLGHFYPDKVKDYADRYSFGLLSEAGAADAPAADTRKAATDGEKTAATKKPDAEKTAESTKAEAKADCAESKGFSEEELSHFNKLNDRKKELDQRETELTALEEELHKQKSEVESRIAKLEHIREEVATVLKDRVEVDQQRVNTLVEFYSNMKPKQAADVFAKLNEDLAVEVLGKMKKKSAADILNLLDPVKARVLSEKFTGYKRD